MSKISFLYIGDVHFGSNKPESRIDDFYETSILKLKEIVEISKKYNVDAILQPGDLFDTPKPPFNVIGDLVNILSPVEKFIMVPGNHEMPGNTESSLERSVLSLLKGINFIEFTSKDNPIFFQKDSVKVAITGSRYTTNIDTTRKDLYVVDEKQGDFHIHLAHGMLSDVNMGELIQHTTIDEIMHTKADITLVGHEHLGFGIIKRNNKIFVNSGAILRLTCSTKEIKRMPKVVLIEIENGEINLKEIELKSSKPGNEVLDRSKLDDKKARDSYKAKLSMFIEEQSSEFDSVAVYELIESMGKSEAIEQNIQDECKDELENIIDELDGQKIENTQDDKNLYISKIILENFESHKYTEINCNQGLNVIVGQSNSGKSSIFKALKWVYMNEPARSSDFISVGEKECRVTVELSNGYKVIREKHRDPIKEKGKKKEEKINRYIVVNPDGSRLWEEGEEANKFNHEKIPQEVKQILKINILKYDSDNEINFNFLEQIKPCFFLDEKATAKAKIMGMFFGTHYIDEDIRRLSAKEKELNKTLKNKENDIEKLTKSISEFNYLDNIQDTIFNIKRMIKRKLELEKEIEVLDKIKDEYKDITNEIQDNEKKIESFNNIDINTINIKNTQLNINLTVDLIEYINEINSLEYNINKNAIVLNHKEKINSLIENLNTISILNIKELVNLGLDYIETNNLLISNKKAIDITDKLENQDYECKYILQNINNIEELKKIYTEQYNINKAINLNSNIIRYKQNIKILEEQIINLDKFKNEYIVLKSSIEEYKNILNELRSLDKAIRLTDAIKENSISNIDIKNKLGNLDIILLETIQYNNLIKDINYNNNDINKNKLLINNKLIEYKEVLRKIGKCPICLADINLHAIERVLKEYSV